MPYIDETDRLHLRRESKRRVIDSIGQLPAGPGELNYMITIIIKQYLGGSPNYTRINEAIGALECAKLELYRRIAVPYEEEKIKENGDVY